MQKPKFKLPDPAPSRRGFLLLVVVGILAVLLTICVGFLSYSRGEVQAVASQRDKSDGLDLIHSAMDWTIANICKDHLDSSGNFDPGTPVAFSNDNATWWYRPSEPKLKAFLDAWWAGAHGGCPPSVSTQTETQYTYLPPDFLPGGGVRGRFTVQVLDTNALLNINDWNDDCMPTQTQMAHMVMDAYGENRGEIWRKWRDVQSTNGWWNVNMYACPIRYQEAWRVATHTQRFLGWQLWDPSSKNDNILSYNWVTGNSSWFTLYGADYSSLHSNLQSDGVAQAWAPAVPNMAYHGSWNYYPPDPPNGSSVWTQNNDSGGLTWIGGWIGNFSIGLQQWYMSGFTTQAGTDPNTGRSPINVNTCYNSGEVLPCMNDQKHPTYTMEGVWNIESLRRLIKIGWFRSTTPVSLKTTLVKGSNTITLAPPGIPPGTKILGSIVTGSYIPPETAVTAILSPTSLTINNAPTNDYTGLINFTPFWHAQADWSILNNKDRMKVEQLKVKLAYQYQETLCRYFTGTYAHTANYRLWDQAYWPDLGTYATAYPTAPAPWPTNYCKTTDYSAPRFPYSLSKFRKVVHDDFLAMTSNMSNPNFNKGHTPAQPAAQPAFPDGTQSYGPDKTDGCVSFDELDTPEVALGKLDMRIAAACYDNMYPGKPADITDFNSCKPYSVNYPNGDPIYELYLMQLGRQEDIDDKYQIDPNYESTPAGSKRPPLVYANFNQAPTNAPSPHLPFKDISETSAPNFSTTRFSTSIADNNAMPYPPVWGLPNPVFMPHDRFLWDNYPAGWGPSWYPAPMNGYSVQSKFINTESGAGSANGNNIYGYWGDNPALPEISGYISGETFPEGNINHRIDEVDHYGMGANVCAKGRDIFSSTNPLNNPGITYETSNYSSPPYDSAPYNAAPYPRIMPRQHWVPTGPWLDGGTDPVTSDSSNPSNYPIWINDYKYTDPNNTTKDNVPWRQLCFTPDSFSTELTTTSNSYMLIINAELVDAASVAANPNSPDAQRRLWWNQWGVIVELSPGMEQQKTGIDVGPNPEINYYLNERPMLRKTASASPVFNPTPFAINTAFYDAANSQDVSCPTLVTKNMDNGASVGLSSYNRVQNGFGSASNDDQNTAPTSGLDPEHNNTTTIMHWAADIHGVPPATSGNFVSRSSVPNNGRAADQVYKGTNPAQKRVLIRSIWCLNDAVRR